MNSFSSIVMVQILHLRVKNYINALFAHPPFFVVLVFFLLVITTNVLAQSNSELMPITEGLSVEAQDSIVTIHTDKKVKPEAQLIPNPPRYVIDIPQYQVPRPKKKSLPLHLKFSAVRAASHEKYVRIVIDLRALPVTAPRITESSKTIQINFAAEIGSTAPIAEIPHIPTSVITYAPTIKPEFTISTIIIPTPTITPTITALIEIEKTELKSTKASPSPTPGAAGKTVAPLATITAVQTQSAAIKPTIATPAKVNITENYSLLEVPQKVELRFSVSDLIINIPFASRGIRDVTVKNRSRSPLFMTAVAEQVFNAGKSEERREPSKSLLVSPRRFELAAGQERLVRIVVTNKNPEEEGVFRINFVPDSEPFKVQNIKPLQPPINAGLSALALARPKIPRVQLVSMWEEEQLLLQNTGNTNIFLDRGKACSGKRCVALPAKRLYAGAKWIISASEVSSVEFLQKTGEDFENIVLKRIDG